VIVASYAVKDLHKKNRRARGWINDFSSKRFIKVFEDAGFQCEHTEKWQSQLIYSFRKSSKQGAALGHGDRTLIYDF
jgi:hypothetical protein